jgi:hypothetical protein
VTPIIIVVIVIVAALMLFRLAQGRAAGSQGHSSWDSSPSPGFVDGDSAHASEGAGRHHDDHRGHDTGHHHSHQSDTGWGDTHGGGGSWDSGSSSDTSSSSSDSGSSSSE